MALHGRQDNAGSFDTLIPLLPDDVSILCLDMPGHGLSSHYPTSQFYYVYWDGIIFLRRIIKHFQWNKVSEWINSTLFAMENRINNIKTVHTTFICSHICSHIAHI